MLNPCGDIALSWRSADILQRPRLECKIGEISNLLCGDEISVGKR